MIIHKSPVNWNESYQNPYNNHCELACDTGPDGITAEDRALYLGLLLQQPLDCDALGNRELPGHGALH